MNDRALTEVVLEGCPLDLLERARRHTESLIREFAFIASSGADRSSVPARLLALVDRIRARISGLNDAIEGQIDRARERGDEFIDLRVLLPGNGRELALELKRHFDEAEEFCRSGDLLTLAEPEDVRAFRTWYLDQYVAQIDGEAPVPWAQWPATAG